MRRLPRACHLKCFTAFVTYASLRSMPASSSASSRTRPAGPTKGRPARSSLSPGCSPTKTISAVRAPSPKTVCVPVFQRSQAWQSAAASRSFGRLVVSGTSGAAVSSNDSCRATTALYPLRANEDGRAERDAAHEYAQVGVARVRAAGGRRRPDRPRGVRPVDGDPVAAGPARRQVRLVGREGDDAAAVEGPVARAGELVCDGEAARRRRRPGTPDADRHAPQDPVALFEQEQATRAVERKADPRARQPNVSRPCPPEAPVRPRRRDDGKPAAPAADDRERLRGAELCPRAKVGDKGAAGPGAQRGAVVDVGDLERRVVCG